MEQARRIPVRLNRFLGVLIAGTGCALHAAAARQESLWAVLGIGLVYAFSQLPLYTLMHEAMHRTFHPSQQANDRWGVFLSAFFPCSFTFVRCTHVGHHRRNRTDEEMFDGYYPCDSLWRIHVFYYGAFSGLFWFSVYLSNLLLLAYPRAMMHWLVQDTPPTAAMINGIPERHVRRIRLECAFAVGVQGLMFWLLGLDVLSYAVLYGCFAFCWSSQNYITHAGSPRDVQKGAFNLRAWKPYSWLLLHFNYHLAHHMHPGVPWIHLPAVCTEDMGSRGYLEAWLSQWKGPVPMTEPPPGAPDGWTPPLVRPEKTGAYVG